MKPNREKQVFEAYDAIICSSGGTNSDIIENHINDGRHNPKIIWKKS
jgi:hypothetical protein